LKQIHIKLAEALHQELRIQAAVKGQSLQDYVLEAIQKQVALDRPKLDLTLAQLKETADDHAN
jgi:hypothetical protein